MTPEDVRFSIDLIAASRRDPEAAHDVQDRLLWKFVAFCCEHGTPEIQSIAREILKVQSLEIPCWYA